MDPKLLLLLPGFAGCPASPAQPSLQAVAQAVVPVREWPERRDQPERTDPPHGEGSGESPMYGGMAAYFPGAANVSNVSARVIVDSGASGIGPYAPAAWLPNRFPLIASTQDFEIKPFMPSSHPNVTMQIGPDTSKHLSNPSTIQTRRAFTRRRS